MPRTQSTTLVRCTKLGCLHAKQGHNYVPYFQLTDDDIYFEPSSIQYSCHKQIDTTQSSSHSSRGAGVQSSMLVNVEYQHKKETSSTSGIINNCLVLKIYRITKCSLNRRLNELQKMPDVSIDDTVEGCITSGQLRQGYELTIHADIQFNDEETKKTHEGNIPAFLKKIKLTGNTENKDRDSKETGGISRELKTIGVVETIALPTINRSTFDEQIEKLFNQLVEKLNRTDLTHAQFEYDPNCLELLTSLSGECTSSKELLRLITIDIKRNLHKVLNFTSSQVSKIERNLEEIMSNHASDEEKAKKVNELICSHILMATPFFDGDEIEIHVATEWGRAYLSVDENAGFIAYTNLGTTFSIERADEKTFYFKIKAGKYKDQYIGIDPSRSCLLAGEKDRAIKWAVSDFGEDKKAIVSSDRRFSFGPPIVPPKIASISSGSDVFILNQLLLLIKIDEQETVQLPQIQYNITRSNRVFETVRDKITAYFKMSPSAVKPSISEAKSGDTDEGKWALKFDIFSRYFIPRILGMSSEETIDLVISATRAGKSTFVALMNGAHFRQEVGNPQKLHITNFDSKIHPVIGSSSYSSETKFPRIYSHFCDFPGTEDSEGGDEDKFHDFTRMITKEMIKKIRSIIIIIDISIIKAGAADLFKKFFKTLTDIINIESLMLPEHRSNIKIIVNLKGDTRYSDETVKSEFQGFEKDLSTKLNTAIDKLKKFIKKWKTNEDAKPSAEEQKEIDSVLNKAALLTRQFIFLHWIFDIVGIPKSNNPTLLGFLKEEMGSLKEKAMKWMWGTSQSKQAPDNVEIGGSFFIWREVNDDALRKRLEHHLGLISTDIPKGAIHEVGTQDTYDKFYNWINKKYWQFLKYLIESKKIIEQEKLLLETKLQQYKQDGKVALLKRLRVQLAEKQTSLKDEQKKKKNLEAKDTNFEDVVLKGVSITPADGFIRLWIFKWFAEATTEEYKSKIPFQEYSEVKQDAVSKKKVTLTPSSPPHQTFEGRYTCGFLCGVRKGLVVAKIKGRGCDSDPKQYEEVKQNIDKLEQDIKELEQSIETIQNLEEVKTDKLTDADREKIKEIEKQIERKEEAWKKIEEQLAHSKLYFIEGYEILRPVFDVFDQMVCRKPNPSFINTSLYLFIKQCEETYPEVTLPKTKHDTVILDEHSCESDPVAHVDEENASATEHVQQQEMSESPEELSPPDNFIALSRSSAASSSSSSSASSSSSSPKSHESTASSSKPYSTEFFFLSAKDTADASYQQGKLAWKTAETKAELKQTMAFFGVAKEKYKDCIRLGMPDNFAPQITKRLDKMKKGKYSDDVIVKRIQEMKM